MLKRWAIAAAVIATGVGGIVIANADGNSPAVVAPASAVRFPGDTPDTIFVGDQQVWPTAPESTSTTTTVEPSTSTSTSVAPSSTSTTSTSTTSTTSSTSSTSSTAPPPSSTTSPPGSPGCGLASAAFCETFDAPHNGGTQTGDLDPTLWGVSRWGMTNLSQGQANAVVPSHNACARGGVNPNQTVFGPSTPPPGDARVCNGQYVESQNDGGAITGITSYPKQPFNFTGRTGTVVFDVSGDGTGTHGAWPEFTITDEPVPGIRSSNSPGNPPRAQNEVGIRFDGCGGQATDQTGPGQIYYTIGGVYGEVNSGTHGCVTKGHPTAMNHVKVEVSTTHIRVSMSDGGGTVMHVVADENLPTLGFSQGLVWLNDMHYNARKAVEPGETGTQFDHSFAWDNLGFDGPKTYRDLGFDVPYANVVGGTSAEGDTMVSEGYHVPYGPTTLTVTGVRWDQTPTKAKVVFNRSANGDDPASVDVSINGHPYVSSAVLPSWEDTSTSIEVPVADVVAGTNTLTFKSTNWWTTLGNISLILVAASPVP